MQRTKANTSSLSYETALLSNTAYGTGIDVSTSFNDEVMAAKADQKLMTEALTTRTDLKGYENGFAM